MYCNGIANLVPMQKENVENTLRQGSTIVLLLASTILENNDSSNTWGTTLLIFACVARLFDCLQDSILEFGKDPWTFIKGNWRMSQYNDFSFPTTGGNVGLPQLTQGQLIMSPEGDNPRTWFVLGGLISTAYLIIQVMHYENEDYEPDSADATNCSMEAEMILTYLLFYHLLWYLDTFFS